MKNKSRFINPYFIVTMSIILTAVILAVADYYRIIRPISFIGPFLLSHWLGIAGAGFIAVYLPLYYFLKRRYSGRISALLNTHIFGNLIAATLITIHFTEQMRRLVVLDTETLVAALLSLSVLLLVITGIFMRFRIAASWSKRWRAIHISVAFAFYILIVFHVLYGLNVISRF